MLPRCLRSSHSRAHCVRDSNDRFSTRDVIETTLAVLGDHDPRATIAPTRPAAPFELLPTAIAELGPGGGAGKGAASLPTLVLRAHGEPPSEGHADLELLSTLGAGGMGQVDLGVQIALERRVAVKRLRSGSSSSGAADALLREARITGALEHPNIVPVHLLGKGADGDPVLVMKRIEGSSWSTLLRDPNHPAWQSHRVDRLERNLEILRQVCHAVHFAHRCGVVHRDIKPENVMVGDFGEVYVVDWGIALGLGRETSLDIAGTPAYMAPEMLRGAKEIDARTDVYLLGATLHEALTGSVRHDGSSLAAAVASCAKSEPFHYPIEVPEELAALCNQATHIDQTQRPVDALAFQSALDTFLRHREAIEFTLRLERKRGAVEAAMAGASTATEEEARAARTSLQEMLQGYRSALELWQDNTPAKEGLQACIERGIEFELRARNVAGAELLLASSSSHLGALEERVKSLRSALLQESAAQDALERLHHDRDRRQGAWARAATLATSQCILGVALIILAQHGYQLSYRTFLAVGSLGLVVFGVQTFRMRRTLLSNSVGRRMQVSTGLFASMVVVETVASMICGVAFSSFLALTAFSVAFGYAMLWLWNDPFARWPAFASTMLGVLTTLFPGHTLESFAVFMFLLAVLSLLRAHSVLRATS